MAHRHSKQLSTLFVFIILLSQGVSAAEQDQGKHLFILSGQSNMRNPLPEAFRDCVRQVFGQDKVLVTTFARPSQPIKMWVKDWQPPEGMTDDKPDLNGSLYDGLLKTTRRAIGDKPIATVTYIWMQGEADAKNGWGSVYEKSFLAILDQLKQDLDIDDINFVVGRINDFWIDPDRFPDGNLVRSIQRGLGDKNTNGDWIDTDDLNRGVNPWGGFSFDDGHFPPPGYRVMGQRFAKKASLLIDPTLQLDPAVFEEPSIDSTEQIQTHQAMGKTVASKAPKPIIKGNPEGLSVLTDGKFAEADASDKHWLIFAPRPEPIELILDLGEVIAIDTIAINTLISSQAKAEFPERIHFRTSVDGETYQGNSTRYNTISFYERGLLSRMRQDGIAPQNILLLTEQRNRKATVKARYIKIEIQTGDQTVYLDEVIVNAKK